jgi:hypothetical protein
VTLQEQVDALKLEVQQLKAELAHIHAIASKHDQRLGPQPQSEADVQKRIDKFVEEVKAAIPPVDRSKQCTTDGRSPAEARASQTNDTGQHPSYIVLCPEERIKGFTRPFRDSYKHVGRLQQLVTDDGADSHQVRVGGCGGITTMGRALSETYARDHTFYSATFCIVCNKHLPVAEFIWTADGQEVGS